MTPAQRIADRAAREIGPEAGAAKYCQHTITKDMTAEEMYVDNFWQTSGVRILTTQDYIDYIYGQKSDKPWLLLIGKTPYGGNRGDQNMFFILLKRMVCTKIAFGDRVNVGILDVFQNEYVREMFDPDISRAGDQAPMVFLVKDGFVHHPQQKNHDTRDLSELLITGKGILQSEPIPYPVNKYTVYWEYIKMFAAKEKILFGALNKFLTRFYPESPIRTRIILPYFTDGRLYTYKQSGKRIIFFFYLPLFCLCCILVYFVWRMIVECLCRRK